MQILTTKPPIYDRLKQHFDIDWDQGIIITYGNDVCCKYPLPPEKIVHESIHVKQQRELPDPWWDKYIADPEFRLKQEIEAYRAEVTFIKKGKNHRSRNVTFEMIRQCALDLSGPTYGNIVTYDRAWKMINYIWE
jgi:hypothetical protein